MNEFLTAGSSCTTRYFYFCQFSNQNLKTCQELIVLSDSHNEDYSRQKFSYHALLRHDSLACGISKELVRKRTTKYLQVNFNVIIYGLLIIETLMCQKNSFDYEQKFIPLQSNFLVFLIQMALVPLQQKSKSALSSQFFSKVYG